MNLRTPFVIIVLAAATILHHWQGWAMKAGPCLRLVMRRSVFPIDLTQKRK